MDKKCVECDDFDNFDDWEEEQRLLSIEHKKRYPEYHYEVGDEVSFISLKNNRAFFLFNSNEKLKEYARIKEKMPNRLIVCEVEYECFLNTITQYLYLGKYTLELNYRDSIFYEVSRCEKIRRFLKEK